MIYVTKGPKNSNTTSSTGRTSYADERPFYVAAYYNYTNWEKTIDRPLLLSLGGNHKSTFDIAAGFRVFDWMRVEANYYKTDFELAGDRLVLDGHTVFANVIFDARINHMYSFLSHQWFVPYVGVGFGVSFNSLEKDTPQMTVDMDRETPFVWGAMAGVAIEFNKSFAIDLGYRYMYMSAPHITIGGIWVQDYTLDDLSPVSHQFRAGVRVSF